MQHFIYKQPYPIMSKTYISSLIMTITSILAVLNVVLPFTNEQLTDTVFITITLASMVWNMFERYKRGDISWTGTRNSQDQVE